MRDLFPFLIIALFLGAALDFCFYRDWNGVVYSLSAAVLNFIIYFRPFH
jgi:hypothetical protein